MEMRRESFIFSGILHVVVALFAIFGVPMLWDKPQEIETPLGLALLCHGLGEHDMAGLGPDDSTAVSTASRVWLTGAPIGWVAQSATVRAATSATSLSPRPLRHRTTGPSSDQRAPSRSRYATAWALSSAGMIPSSRASPSNAASASASVTLAYAARPLSLRNACSGPTPG